MIEELRPDKKKTLPAPPRKIHTYATHFCGVGGACLGLERTGLKCVFAIDNKELAVEYREKNLGHKAVLGDITTYQHPPEAAADVLWTSPPCQTFSISAYEQTLNKKKLGIKDKRDNLFLCSLEYVNEFQPKFFVLENVVGLLTHGADGVGNGTKENMIRAFANAGYDVEWNILNSADFGVPQLRERVFIIGARKDLGLKGLIPNDGADAQGYPTRPRLPYSAVMEHHVVSKAWSGKTYKTALKAFQRTGRYITVLMPDEQIPTITCGFGGGATRKKVGICDCTKDKKLDFVRHPTVKEGSRCQGFPEDWQWPKNESEAWTLIGNAVTATVASMVGFHLIALSNGETPPSKKTLPASRLAEYVRSYGKEADEVPAIEYDLEDGKEEDPVIEGM